MPSGSPGIESDFGGEVTAYTSECNKARREAMKRMVDEARRLGANAVVGVDFETSDILQGMATLFSCWGTAVIATPKRQA